MNTEPKRTCATCCSYDDGICMNMVSFISENGQRVGAKPDDTCEDHKTFEEDRRDDEAMARFRIAIGLPLRKPW